MKFSKSILIATLFSCVAWVASSAVTIESLDSRIKSPEDFQRVKYAILKSVQRARDLHSEQILEDMYNWETLPESFISQMHQEVEEAFSTKTDLQESEMIDMTRSTIEKEVGGLTYEKYLDYKEMDSRSE